MPPIFDISGVLNVQSQYLHDLGNSNTNGITVTNGIKNLQDYLNTLKGAIASSGASTADILTKQSDVNQIVTDETNRLNRKKQQIYAKTFMSQRMAQLNDNYKNRQAYINKIFIIIVIGLLIFIGLIKLKNWMPFIPSGIFDLLITILFAVIIIVVVVKIYAMNQRDNLNFDELKLPPMPQENKYQETKAKVESGNLLGAVQGNQCIGQDCCPPGTTWNEGLNKCYPTCPNGTDGNPDQNWDTTAATPACSTTASGRDSKACGRVFVSTSTPCGTDAFSCMNNQTPPFTPSEFSEYSLYNNIIIYKVFEYIII